MKENRVEVVTKDCENVGVAFDQSERRDFTMTYVVSAADKSSRFNGGNYFDIIMIVMAIQQSKSFKVYCFGSPKMYLSFC